MKITANSYISMGIMVAMVVVIGACLGMKHLGSKAVPLVISSAVFILAAVDLGKQLMAKDGTETSAKTAEVGKRRTKAEEWRGYLPIGAWILGFSLTYYLFGYIIAIFLLVLSYTRSHGTKWLTAIIMAILNSALVYGIFEVALQVNLYQGLVFEWLGY